MQQKLIRVFLVPFVLCSLSVLALAQEEADEEAMAVSDAPAAVQQTVREQSQGATVRGFSREEEDGQVVYELELKVDGHTKDMLIDASGAILSIEEEIEPAELPPAVRSTLEQKAAGGRILFVESITEHGKITGYEAKIESGGHKHEVTIDPQGRIKP